LGMPGQHRHFYICLGRPPAPMVYVSPKPHAKDLAAYGPFVGRAGAETAIRRLNDLFRLRDCSAKTRMEFAGESTLFPEGNARAALCLRFELGTCMGPCAGLCHRREYTQTVQKLKAFLDGRDPRLVIEVEKQMHAAAEALQFERAASLRDKLSDLTWLEQRLGLLRRSRDQATYVLPMTDATERELWLILHRGQVVAVRRPPNDPDQNDHAKLVADCIAGRPPVCPTVCHPVDSVLLVAAWFRKNPDIRKALRAAKDVLRDPKIGGFSQAMRVGLDSVAAGE
ncbi:MAG: UvrB/UvrC motif-containing protein, partial [Gemmataceae bacterium]